MAKQKKRIVRPQYVTKSVRIKQAPKKPIPKELKIGIIFSACALVLATILFFAFYNDGSLPMSGDLPVLEGDNWLVVNTGTREKPRYYKVGEFGPIDGYTLRPEENPQNNLYVYTFDADDPDARIGSFYIAAINQVSETAAQGAMENYTAFAGASMDISPVAKVEMDGAEIDYFTTATPPAPDTQTGQQLVAYYPSIRNTCILINLSVQTSEESPSIPEQDMLDLLESIKQAITLEEK